MKALIIAAGEGSRFGVLTKDTPKPLLKIGEKYLIEWVMDALIEGGIDDIYITIGYLGEKIKKAIGNSYNYVNITYVDNPNWKLGNLTSLYAAKDMLSSDFILSMSDHLFDPIIVHNLIDFDSPTTVLLAADRKYQQTDDDMKVLVENYYIKNIGKNIIGNFVDTGLFKMKTKIFEYAKQVMAQNGYQLYLTVLEAAKKMDAMILDINRRFWIDVDTPEELNSYYVQRFPHFMKNGRWS